MELPSELNQKEGESERTEHITRSFTNQNQAKNIYLRKTRVSQKQHIMLLTVCFVIRSFQLISHLARIKISIESRKVEFFK